MNCLISFRNKASSDTKGVSSDTKGALAWLAWCVSFLHIDTEGEFFISR